MQAGEQLVVLEVESNEVCETGIGEEAELNWKDDKEKAQEPCREIKHVFARTARDSPDVHFLALEVPRRFLRPYIPTIFAISPHATNLQVRSASCVLR